MMICTNCGFTGKSEKITKGSMSTELFLWILFLIPGLLYSFWRLATKYEGCPKCKSANMIPEDSPVGKKLKEKSV